MVHGAFNVTHCSKTKVLSYHVEVNVLHSENFVKII